MTKLHQICVLKNRAKNQFKKFENFRTKKIHFFREVQLSRNPLWTGPKDSKNRRRTRMDEDSPKEKERAKIHSHNFSFTKNEKEKKNHGRSTRACTLTGGGADRSAMATAPPHRRSPPPTRRRGGAPDGPPVPRRPGWLTECGDGRLRLPRRGAGRDPLGDDDG